MYNGADYIQRIVMKVLSILVLFISVCFANIIEFKSYQAKFTQSITNASGNTISYNGNIKIKGEDKILWQYQTPTIKNVYIANNTIAIVEPELEQVILSTLNEKLNIIKIINNSKKISLNLFENKMDGITYQIRIIDGLLENIKYKDELDNDIEIVFLDGKKDIKLSNDIFYFNPPEYYDIIRK
jgi:outer membrane lipoprotein carrier protein